MIVPLILLLAARPEGLVGGEDNRPTATVAEGYGKQLAVIKAAAEKCGFSRTWVWDDDTSRAELWVLASDVRPQRIARMRKWKQTAGSKVKWVLAGLR